MAKHSPLLTVVAMLALAVTTAWAGVPQEMNYQGVLKNSVGAPMPGVHSMTFRLYRDSIGGVPLWEEPRSVTVDGAGLFNLLLGEVTPIPDSVFAGNAYIGISVDPDGEMARRVPLSSVGYAYRVNSVDAATGGTIYGDMSLTQGSKLRFLSPGEEPYLRDVNGLKYSGDLLHPLQVENAGLMVGFTSGGGGISPGDLLVSGNVGIGTTDPTSLVDIRGAVQVSHPGAFPNTVPYGTLGVTRSADNTNNSYIALTKQATIPWGIGIGPVANLIIGVATSDPPATIPSPVLTMAPNGNVGIGTTSPRDALEVYGTISCRDLRVYGDLVNFHEIRHNGTTGNMEIAPIGGRNVIISNGNVGIGTPTPGAKLHVVGDLCVTGQKNAIVPTSQGMTKLYSEESSELWFSDYGRAHLSGGRCHIDLDHLFLETVAIDGDHPMMVFLQEEDECSGLLVKTGHDGFDVIEKAGGRSDAQFSYRVVAKRKGYEGARLETVQNASSGGGR